MLYTTKQVKNLSTGEPFVFDVSEKDTKRFEDQKKMIETGSSSLFLPDTVEGLIEQHEFSMFPAFEEVSSIFRENGYTEELMTKILLGFGVPESFIPKLLEDEKFINSIVPWFSDITCDGGRAIRTLKIVYRKTAEYFNSSPEKERTLIGDIFDDIEDL